jgi:hypothetical protein
MDDTTSLRAERARLQATLDAHDRQQERFIERLTAKGVRTGRINLDMDDHAMQNVARIQRVRARIAGMDALLARTTTKPEAC